MTTAPLATVPTGAVTPIMSRQEWDTARDKWADDTDFLIRAWTYNKFGTQEDLAEALGKGVRSVQRRIKSLRDSGFMKSLSEDDGRTKSAKVADPVENPTPPNSSWSERSTLNWDPTTPNPPTPVYEAEVVIDDPIVLSHAEPVPFSEPRPQPYRNPAAVERELTDQVGSEDYQRVIQLVDDISVILKQHAFKGTFSISEWSSCLGGFQSLAAVASAQHNNVQQYAGMEQRVDRSWTHTDTTS